MVASPGAAPGRGPAGIRRRARGLWLLAGALGVLGGVLILARQALFGLGIVALLLPVLGSAARLILASWALVAGLTLVSEA